MPRSGHGPEKNATPFPLGQILIVALVRFAEPVAFTCIFPYIFFMIRDFHLTDDEHQIARYASIVSSCFSFSQVLTSFTWGQLSDRFGRKPILICGLMGTTISTLAFGFSVNLPMAVFTRSIAGLLNGNVAVIRTVIGEIATERDHQPLAFSVMPILWQIGCILGPIIGGTLANPAKQYPDVFGGIPLFNKFPYCLPNLVVGAMLLFSLIMAVLFLEETSEAKRDRYDPGLALGKKIIKIFKSAEPEKNHLEVESSDDEEEVDESTRPLLSLRRTSSYDYHHEEHHHAPTVRVDESSELSMLETTPWKKIFSSQVLQQIFSYTILSLHTVAFDELFPIILSGTPSSVPPRFPFWSSGGLGYSSTRVGMFLSSTGIFGIFIMFFIFPFLDYKLGTLTVYRVFLSLNPVVYILTSQILFLIYAPESVRTVCVTLLLIFKTFAASLAYAEQNLLLNRSTAYPQFLGSINGLAQVCAATARTIGPISAGTLMSVGQGMNEAGLVWWCAFGIAILGMIQSIWLVDGDLARAKEDKLREERGEEPLYAE